MTPTVLVQQYKTAVIRAEGANVVVIVNGTTILDLPWDAAIALARGMISKAKTAEVNAKALEIVSDQALLIRAGMPFNLTLRPDLIKLAGNMAAWDSDLRRYMPNRIDQRGTVYELEVTQVESSE